MMPDRIVNDRRFRFGLRTLFVLVALASIACFIVAWMFGGQTQTIFLKRDSAGRTVIYRGRRAVSEAELKSLLGKKLPQDNQKVILSADNDVPYVDVVKLTDLASGLGYDVSLQAKSNARPAMP